MIRVVIVFVLSLFWHTKLLYSQITWLVQDNYIDANATASVEGGLMVKNNFSLNSCDNNGNYYDTFGASSDAENYNNISVSSERKSSAFYTISTSIYYDINDHIINEIIDFKCSHYLSNGSESNCELSLSFKASSNLDFYNWSIYYNFYDVNLTNTNLFIDLETSEPGYSGTKYILDQIYYDNNTTEILYEAKRITNYNTSSVDPIIFNFKPILSSTNYVSNFGSVNSLITFSLSYQNTSTVSQPCCCVVASTPTPTSAPTISSSNIIKPYILTWNIFLIYFIVSSCVV